MPALRAIIGPNPKNAKTIVSFIPGGRILRKVHPSMYNDKLG